jgi:hypothetical protein
MLVEYRADDNNLIPVGYGTGLTGIKEHLATQALGKLRTCLIYCLTCHILPNFST